MSPIRSIARLLMSGVFISGGVNVLRDPAPRVSMAQPFIEKVAATVPAVPSDPLTLVRANAVVHVVAGSMLALGILPRLAAAALAGSLVPTTFGGHRFWEVDDPRMKAQQQTHFLKNAAILGGLLLAAFG